MQLERLRDFRSQYLPEEEVRHHLQVFKGLEEGDREASTMALLAQLGGLIGRFLLKLPEQDREDGLSQIVERLLRAFDEFDLERGVKLTTFAHFFLKSGYQQAQEQTGPIRVPYSAWAQGWRPPPLASLSSTQDEEDRPIEAASEEDIEGEVAATEKVERWLETLQPLQQEVAGLLMQGYQHKEAAFLLGLTQGHVKRIVKSLREAWVEAEGDGGL